MKVKKTVQINEDAQDLEKMQDQIEAEEEAGAAKVDVKQAAAVKAKENKLERELTQILKSNDFSLRNLVHIEVSKKRGVPTYVKYLGPQNILISGPAGVGKSSIIEDWAKAHKCHLVKVTGAELNPDSVQGAIFKDMKKVTNIADNEKYAALANTMSRSKNKIEECYKYLSNFNLEEYDVSDWSDKDIEDAIEDYDIPEDHQASVIKAIKLIQRKVKRIKAIQADIGEERTEMHSKMVTTDFFQALNEPDSILFIDEINRSNPRVRATILDMIQSHNIPDSNSDTNRTFLPNFLFTIAAQNPTADRNGNTTGKTFGSNEVTQLDSAMLTRFKQFDWYPDISETREFLIECYTAEEKDYTKLIGTDQEEEENTLYKTMYPHTADQDDITSENMAIIARNKRQMVELLLKPGTPLAFNFDTDYLEASTNAQKNTLNARTLTTLINDSMGDKQRLIDGVIAWVGKGPKSASTNYLTVTETGEVTGGLFLELLKDYKPEPLNIANKGIYNGRSEYEDELKKYDAEQEEREKKNAERRAARGITKKELEDSDILDKALDTMDF